MVFRFSTARCANQVTTRQNSTRTVRASLWKKAMTSVASAGVPRVKTSIWGEIVDHDHEGARQETARLDKHGRKICQGPSDRHPSHDSTIESCPLLCVARVCGERHVALGVGWMVHGASKVIGGR